MTFVLCELGEHVAQKFDTFNMELCQCNWYMFPIKIQRMFQIFITDTQKPKFIRTRGNILCTREVFKEVNFLKKLLIINL